MTNEEILNKAIEKAEENGFPKGFEFEDSFNDDLKFMQDFAKAFFGEEVRPVRYYFPHLDRESMEMEMREPDIIPVWKFHLQQIVISEDPIKYLEQHL